MPSTPSQDTNAPKPYIGVGDVVQITPSADRFYAGCLLVVTEIKSFGVQGYIQQPGENGGFVYCRPRWENIVRIGKAVYIQSSDEDDDAEAEQIASGDFSARSADAGQEPHGAKGKTDGL